ncbi:MAG: LPS export ABC transporter periplasmic protein LptC [Povalibacter sp.]
MNWRWISIAALLAAVVIGLGVLSGGGTEDETTSETPEQPAYYLKDAIITQTDELGAPAIKLVANRIEQRPGNNDITLHSVRVDYFKVPDKQWFLSADRGLVPANSHTIQFEGDVQLRPIDGPPSTVLQTEEISIDTDRNIAYTTSSPVAIRFGTYAMNVKRFEADLKTEKVKMESVHGRSNAG